MDQGTDAERLLTEAEAALPTVLRALYADQLRDSFVAEENGRRFYALSDSEGKQVELRLDTAALPQPLLARTFTNTTTDRYVVQLADTLAPTRVGEVLSREVGELLAVRERTAVNGKPPLRNLLAPGAALPAHPELSDQDLGRVGQFNYLAARMNDAALTAPERREARDRFSTLIDESGLRPVAPASDEQEHTAETYAAKVRMDIALPHLRAQASDALEELAVPLERLSAVDARALGEARATRAAQEQAPQPLGEFPMPGLRPDGTPLPREELGQAAAVAAEQRTALSGRTLDQLRAEQAALPEGRYPQREVMIGGGAALAGRDPDVLLIDARGRWHVDPIKAIVQSADQVRHLRESGMGDPYQFADPKQRVPLPALQLWEDTAAARGPLVDGRANLSINAAGRLIAEISPADGSKPIKIEVKGSPLVATGIPPEIIPGANRQVPTVPEATEVLAEHLLSAGTPQALRAREQLLNLPDGEDRAAASLNVLTDPLVASVLQSSVNPRVAGATETLRATAAWEHARAAAPDRVLMGDEVGDGAYDPLVANNWVIAGVGGAAIANAEIILEANPEARVSMVGKDAPFVLHNDAQYTELRRKHDAQYGGDGRLVTYSDRYLGAVGTVTGPDGQVRLAALDSAGNPLGIEGDAYVACLGRISRTPETLDSLESWARASGGQIDGELVFDKDRQYLGYQLAFEADGERHSVHVTGAASRMLPGNIFSRDDMARLAVLDAKTTPPESGNVAAGFMATALQASHLARHRATEDSLDGPPMPPGQTAERPSASTLTSGIQTLSIAARSRSTTIQTPAEQAEQAAARAREAAKRLTAQAEQLRTVLGTDAAPGRRLYALVDARLTSAEDCLVRADAADQRANTIDGQVRALLDDKHEASRREQDLRERAALTRSGLLGQRKRLVTEADELAGQVARRTEQISTLRQQATDLHSEAEHLRAQAREQVDMVAGGSSHRPVSDRIAECRARLPQIAERAEKVDRQDYDYLVKQAADQHRAAEGHTRRAAELRKEAARQEQLPPAQRAREAAERSQALRQQAQRRAAEQARQVPGPRRRPPGYGAGSAGSGGISR
ncbi:hypothetical protein [Streptomyces griseocarneus]|uniref:hypothetical protein n=1 Tax=Streptomyces griseocarneus TaxID=51201 RepID=UPI00167EC820|nr:hypothetical protein [Streptomyces griseocarneus]MBZ6475872.1 hypothetical protein [Streptomyces griseocarneus]GHG50277.1 hypothetical protein GCM10018779_10260 [Streptomyces griseocarneus]